MILLRSLLFLLLFYVLTAIMGVIGLPLLIGPGRWSMAYGTAWSSAVLALLRVVCDLDYEVRGRANLPSGPVIIAMKHQSAWDTFAAPVVFRHPVVVLKRELGWIPIYGWYALKSGMIPIDRAAGAAALRRMVAAAAPAIAAGRPIIIFPEGTRTAVGTNAVYQPGVFALYRALDLPLVPVAVNSGVFWGRRRVLKRPGRIVVEILPPIPPGGSRSAVMPALAAATETATRRLVEAAEA